MKNHRHHVNADVLLGYRAIVIFLFVFFLGHFSLPITWSFAIGDGIKNAGYTQAFFLKIYVQCCPRILLDFFGERCIMNLRSILRAAPGPMGIFYL